jgi:flagellar motility protein MotE (MotC chaperone)
MRALPLGIAALTLLLALKLADAGGILSAQAEETAAKTEEAPSEEAAPAEEAPAGDHAEAAAGEAGAHEADAHDTEALETDKACVTDGPTASESDVLERLADRRKQLDQRERDLDMREKLIGAAEKRVEERVTELKAIEGRIEAMFGKRTEQEEAQLASLVKMYEAMKPANAAAIFDTLEQGVLIDVVSRMKPAKAATVLAAMKPERAQEVTVELARHFEMPKDDPAAAAADPAEPPSAGDPAPPGG